MPESDLDELAAWARAGRLVPGDIRPSDLQRRYRLTFSQACTALEALEARGDLERIPGATLAWRPVPPDPSGALSLFKPDGRRLSIILSDKEHAALLRLLDAYLADWQRPEDSEKDLRSLRSKLEPGKGGAG